MSFSLTNKNDHQKTPPKSSRLSKHIIEKEISHQIPARSQSKSNKYSKSAKRSTKPIKRRRKSRIKSWGRVLNCFGVYGFQYIALLFGFALFIGVAHMIQITKMTNNKNCYESDTLVPRPLGLNNHATVQPDSEWFEGDIVVNNGIKWIKYYGILYDSTLNLYKEKPTIDDIIRHRNIYDMINISQFYDIAEYKIDTTDDVVSVNGSDKVYSYGITFADHCGQFDVERFLFDNEQQRHDWYKRFKLDMAIDQAMMDKNKKMKTMQRSQCKCIVQCGWILYGKYDFFWMELMENSTELLFYKDNKNEKDKKVLKYMDLLKHEHVKYVDNPNKNTFVMSQQ